MIEASTIRAYYVTSESWWGTEKMRLLAKERIVEEIVFGMFSADGQGSDYELGMRWHALSGIPTPRLEIFQDSWAALEDLHDVFTALAKSCGKCISPSEFAALLLRLGFTDHTKRETPT